MKGSFLVLFFKKEPRAQKRAQRKGLLFVKKSKNFRSFSVGGA
jgi:hypothetical protein